MGFTKALFYPTIEIENEDWLKTAILFWDEISTIVPQTITNPYKLDSSKYLSDNGLLIPIYVNDRMDLIEGLTDDTLNYINTSEGFQLLTQNNNGRTVIHRDKLPRDVGRLFGIHPSKLPSEIRHILHRSLSDDGFFHVDENFAFFYMTLLANRICEEKGIALLTDNILTSNLSDKARLNNQIAFSGGDEFEFHRMRHRGNYVNLVQGMLTNLIIKSIKVSPDSSIEDIVNFKNRHLDELGLFRSNITKLTQSVINVESYEAILQVVNEIYKDELLPSYNNLKKSLESSGVKWVADNFMKISLISTGTTLLLPSAFGLTQPQALLAGMGVSLVTSLISYNEDKEGIIRNNPYSYLLSINKGI